MAKAILFEERINKWAEMNGVTVDDMDYIDITGFYYVSLRTPEICWKDLKELEKVCNNMGIEIYNIAIDSTDKECNIYTVWIA